AELLLGNAAVEVGESKGRIQLDGPRKIGDSFLELPGIEVGVAAVVGDQWVLAVQREGCIVVGEGAIEFGALGVDVGPVEVGGGDLLRRTLAELDVRLAAAQL